MPCCANWSVSDWSCDSRRIFGFDREKWWIWPGKMVGLTRKMALTREHIQTSLGNNAFQQWKTWDTNLFPIFQNAFFPPKNCILPATMNAYPAYTWKLNEGGMSISASYSHQVHFSSHQAKLLNLNVHWNLLEIGNVKYTKRSRTHLTWMTLFSCLKSHSHSCSVMGVAWSALHESDNHTR